MTRTARVSVESHPINSTSPGTVSLVSLPAPPWGGDDTAAHGDALMSRADAGLAVLSALRDLGDWRTRAEIARAMRHTTRVMSRDHINARLRALLAAGKVERRAAVNGYEWRAKG